MDIKEVVDFWSLQRKHDNGNWMHPDDEEYFATAEHSFNLQFPVSPYVGDILQAPAIILGASAGYSPDRTPLEFPNEKVVEDYVKRVREPSGADWSSVSKYYDNVNYGNLLVQGRAALINACPYRSRKISEEPDNLKLINRLPSVAFNRL